MFDCWEIHVNLLNFLTETLKETFFLFTNLKKQLFFSKEGKERALKINGDGIIRNVSFSFQIKFRISGYFRNVNKHLCIYSFLETGSRKREITYGTIPFLERGVKFHELRERSRNRERERRGQNWPYPVAEQRMNAYASRFPSTAFQRIRRLKSFEIRKI